MPFIAQKSPIEEPEPKSGRLAWHIENTLVRFIKRVFNDLGDFVMDLIANTFMKFLELIEPEIIGIAEPVLAQMEDIPGLPPEYKQLIGDVRAQKRPAAGALAVPILLAGLIGLLMGPIGVISRFFGYQTDNVLHTGRIDPVTGMQMLRRGGLTQETFDRDFSNLGWTEDYRQAFYNLTRNLLEPGELTTALYRGEIDETQFRSILKQKGYEEDDISLILTILPVIPGVGDLIRMAVREAFNPEIIAKFGYDKDWPPEFGFWAEKQGLSKEWAEKFWYAHWELPGVRDAFEMLHRRIINPTEMNDLLRAKDIPVFWRDALIQMSFSPYTRVDVRRMYKTGTISETEVYETYLDLGYDETRARKLTDWTIEEYTQEALELTKGDIVSSYTDGIIKEEDARSYLNAIGRKPLEIDLLIARADLKRQEEFEKELIKNVRVSFVAGIIQENDVYQQLSDIDPPAGFVEDRLKIWRIQRARGIRKPTLANLRDFWIAKTIDENRLRSEMRLLGYADLYVDLFIQYWTIKYEL